MTANVLSENRRMNLKLYKDWLSTELPGMLSSVNIGRAIRRLPLGHRWRLGCSD